MALSYCDSRGSVHAEHVIHEPINNGLVICHGDSEFSLAETRRAAEIREAKAQAKHERKLARIQRRTRFGFSL